MEREVIFMGKKYPLIGTHKRVGDAADNFTLYNGDMEPVDLYSFGDCVKIVSSCNSIDTPICSIQAKRLNAEMFVTAEKLTGLFISVDLPFTLSRFSFEEDMSHISMFSDYLNLDFGLKYGLVIEPLRILARSIMVIDKDNIIRYIEYLVEQDTQPNYNKAIALAKKLSQ